MTKYHINDKGKPAVCKAVKGNCPFGDADTHYNSKEEAQVEVNKRNQAKYSLLPGTRNKGKTNNKKFVRKATKKDNAYVNGRKKFLSNETPAPTYIEKCRSATKIENYDFYKKDREKETRHFDHDRKGRLDKLENIYGDGETVGFYEVDHQVKGTKYKKQVVEIKSTGQLVIYDKHKGHKVTSFMAHRARIETMIILAGEIPDQDFMNEVTTNHTNDLKRQAIDRKKNIA